jgi:ribosome maturation factor RimP
MDKDAIQAQLLGIVTEYLEGMDVVLVDMSLRGQGRDMYLTVLVDKPHGGISIGECARVNGGLTAIIEEGNFFPEGYFLEVSSPGIDRPLTNKADFMRCRGVSVQVFLREKLHHRCELSGTIGGVDDEALELVTPAEVIRIPLLTIDKAEQII